MNSNILLMGGYGVYVWPAYGLTLGLFAYQLFSLYVAKKQIQKKVKRYHNAHAHE